MRFHGHNRPGGHAERQLASGLLAPRGRANWFWKKTILAAKFLAEGVRKDELVVMRRLRLPDYHRCFQALQYEGIQLRSII